MCILCDHGTLELLTVPLEQLAPGRLAEAVRAAREAAGPGIMDHAEAVLRGEATSELGPEFYGEVVVGRAVDSGVLASPDASRWGAWLATEAGLTDPRVQAFLSSCTEILDEYATLHTERRQLIERFIEAAPGRVSFLSLGPDGELWFDYDQESYAALTMPEAREIVERELSARLHSMESSLLARYTGMGEGGLEVLAGIQEKPPELANSLLAGLIDLGALAEDQIRASGYAPFFVGEPPRPVEDLRFGDWVIIRVQAED